MGIFLGESYMTAAYYFRIKTQFILLFNMKLCFTVFQTNQSLLNIHLCQTSKLLQPL